MPAVQLLPNCCWDSTMRSNRLTMSLSSAPPPPPPLADSLDGIWALGRRFLAFLDRPCLMPMPAHRVAATHASSNNAAAGPDGIIITMLSLSCGSGHRTTGNYAVTATAVRASDQTTPAIVHQPLVAVVVLKQYKAHNLISITLTSRYRPNYTRKFRIITGND